MPHRRLPGRAHAYVVVLGAALFVVAVAHHGSELAVVERPTGPLSALLIDGPPAIAVAYAGYRLSRTDIPPSDRWAVLRWCLAAGTLFVAAVAATFLIRVTEGRTVAEPVFPLLIAAEFGALAGLVAGYYAARSRADARRAQTTSEAFAFVNDLIRHDLRNDLNVIQGYASTIEADDPDSDAPEVVAEKAGEALARIETTEAIAETLTGNPDLEPVDLAGVVVEMAARIDETFDVTVRTDLPDRAPVVANSGVRSVVDNLLENAAEHNDADDPRVEAVIETDGDVVRLQIADNGPGIPDELAAAAFGDDTGAVGGGGLALVATLVEGYGGAATVEDTDPRGSVVTVELPRAPED